MLEIAEADILKSLKRDNTWWLDGRAALPSDLRKRAYFEPFVKVALNWDVNRSVVLMGPRRVGKTVMLKQLVEYALSGGFPAGQLFMVSLDTPLYSGMALERLLQLFEKQSLHDPGSRRVMIFDEIQYLKDWEVHLKALTDRYPDTRFIVSGSAAAALRLKSLESGAGRFTEFFLPPLTFAEFLDFKGIEDDLIMPRPVEQRTRYETRDIHRLNREFIEYLNYGGYPEAVLNEYIQQDVTRYLGRDIIDKVLLRDLPSLYGIHNVQELNRLFSTIAYHSGQEINLQNLATSSGVGKNTISRYLEYLEAAFLIVRVRRVDDSGKTFQRNRNFKVYLINPSMRCALFSPLHEEDEAMGFMAETAIFSQWVHSDFMRNIHYARWKKGRQDL
ncbi:MAG: ATP-binding protein, partial [Proteobacteria bacterium]|nr:ATP-binding protein [Pseudomonadota bacterium]